jgi:hypothetical protein
VTPRSSNLLGRALVLVASAWVLALPRATPARADEGDAVRLPLRIGFDGAYKLGCWTPVWVDVAAEQGWRREGSLAAVEITAPDTDGLPCTFSARAATPGDDSGRLTTWTAFIRVGQEHAPLLVRLIDDQGRRFTRPFVASSQPADGAFPKGLPATSRLIVTLGAREDLAAPLARRESDVAAAEALHTVLLNAAADLPTAWHGYESVDAVLLSGADAAQYDLPREELAPRMAALVRWVELGGRLVVFCGADSAALLAEDGPLAPLVPGRYAGETVSLQDFAPLEIFSAAAEAVTRVGVARFRVPRLVDVEGELLAEGPGRLPLVVRTRRGLGAITFVAVDPETPPLNRWSERSNLVRQALAWPAPSPEATRRRSNLAAADLSNNLRSALDQHFSGVAATPFAMIAGLVLLYVAVIGPADYFLLRRAGRMQATWATFPLAVIAVSGAAYALAYRAKGRELLVNQVEIVDVDLAARTARGTVVTHLFNPRVARFDLTIEPRFAGAAVAGDEGGLPPPQAGPAANPSAPRGRAAPLDRPSASTLPSRLVAWLGVPGPGLGAMQGQRGQFATFDRGYDITAQPAEIVGLPVEQWSTKSLIARWTGDVSETLDAELHLRGGDLLEGRIVNRTGVRLEDGVLIHGSWAYKLPELAAGAEAAIDDALPNATIKTMLTGVAAGDDPRVRKADDGSVAFNPLSTDVARIAKLMMFYEALGGAAYAGTPNEALGFLDLSRLVRGDQAVLVARAPASAGSWWRAHGTSLGGAGDRHWVYYRFVIPVTKKTETPLEAPGPVFGPPLTSNPPNF